MSVLEVVQAVPVDVVACEGCLDHETGEPRILLRFGEGADSEARAFTPAMARFLLRAIPIALELTRKA